jgi:catechol 2,3-dioxygenase-like lactoylglutathione lyase family enzyme
MRLECVGIRVSNLERSVRFYSKALGLRVIRRDDCRSWGGGVTALLQDPASRRVVELNWYPRNSMFSATYRRGDELDHIDVSLGASPRSALERAYRRLLRNGGRATRFTPSATDGWAAMVKDPDGIWIRLGRSPTTAERRSGR